MMGRSQALDSVIQPPFFAHGLEETQLPQRANSKLRPYLKLVRSNFWSRENAFIKNSGGERTLHVSVFNDAKKIAITIYSSWQCLSVVKTNGQSVKYLAESWMCGPITPRKILIIAKTSTRTETSDFVTFGYNGWKSFVWRHINSHIA